MLNRRPRGQQGQRASVVLDKDALRQLEELRTFYHQELGIPLAVSGIARRALGHLAAHVHQIRTSTQAAQLLTEKSLAGACVRPKPIKDHPPMATHEPSANVPTVYDLMTQQSERGHYV